MNDYIAYCGLDCETCEARLATVKNEIRTCAMQKQVETCGDCPEMRSCEKVGAIIGNNSEARDRLYGYGNP